MSGVVMTAPPERLIPDLRASMADALAQLRAGEQGALVAVATDAGVNAAVVARVGGDWQVQAWIGKRWGAHVQGGALVVRTW
jgi:hypothetical protein